MDGLPAEVLAKIQAQKEKLQKEFEEYAAKQQEAKLIDICSAAGVSKEEAGFALGLCHNDELEAINKLATDSAFKLKVQEMANGTDSGAQYSEDDDDDDLDSFESDGEGGRRQKRRRRSTRQKTTTIKTTTTTDSSQPTIKINRQHVEGFNVDGTPRAPTIRLGDALKRLEEIRKAKKSIPSPSKATASSSSSTKALSSPARSSPTKASSAKSPSPTTKIKSPASAKKAVAKATTPTSKRSAAASKKSSPASAKSATPVSQANRATTPRKRKADSEEEPTDAVSASSSEGKKKAVAASPVKKATASSKSDDEYTYEDLKSLEWSDARIKAFLGRKSNPNAYYYRFNDPDEEQRTGAWTEEEHKLFMELIKDGVDYHWGIFSIKTPGRVGYQCSNYYRKLIADGVVKDPNYQVDENGKLTFARGVTKRMPRGGASGGDAAGSAIQPTITDAEPKKRPTATKKTTKRRRSGSEDSGMEQNGGYEDSESEDEVDGKREYLLGSMQDAMTLKPMKTPAISPYGHVLDYTTWLRLLKAVPLNTCPFTKQRVTRRDLIKLTKENVEQYRSKIVTVAFDIVPASSTTTTATSNTAEVEAELSSSAVEHHNLVSSSSMQQIESNA